MKSVLPNKNIFPYCSIDDFWKEMSKRKTTKYAINTIKNKLDYRAIEEIKFFIELDEQKRLELYNLINILSIDKKRKTKPLTILTLENPIVPEHLKEPLEKLIEGMLLFDAIEANKIKMKQEERKQKVEKQLGYMDLTMDDVKSESEASIKAIPLRQSDRVIIKRRFSWMSEASTSNESVENENKPPVIKKPKLDKAIIPFEKRFTFNPKHITNLFKITETNQVCIECQTDTNEPTHKCSECSLYFHKICSHRVEQRKEQFRHLTGDSELLILVDHENPAGITCNSCMNANTICALCNKPLSENKSNNYSCNLTDCKQSYHIKCLTQCPQSKTKKNTCPQHACHTCFSKNINKTGTLVKCVKCPSTYHGDIFCLPAGSQVISKTKIICPRHPAKKENATPLNLNSCSMCDQGGTLLCCDNCPKSYHQECLPEDSNVDEDPFHCDDCKMGNLPTYNSCVWAKVGTFRWWPGYIVTPPDAEGFGKQQFKRQFCVRFFGDYNHYWFTHERVLICTDDPSCTNLKVKKSLDKGFKTAVEEVTKMLAILDTEYENTVKVVPKQYAKIVLNKIVKPAKLKKKIPSEICHCSPDDPAPCGFDSECIVRKLSYECNKFCPAGEKCQNRDMQKRNYATDLDIFYTKKRGFGARTKQDIKEGALVIEYVGEIINHAEMISRKKAKCECNDNDFYFFTLDSDTYIDAGPSGNLARFINHSCAPNCTALKINIDGFDHVGIYATHDIKAVSFKLI